MQVIESRYHEIPMISVEIIRILTMKIRLYWSEWESCLDLIEMDNIPLISVAIIAIVNSCWRFCCVYYLCCVLVRREIFIFLFHSPEKYNVKWVWVSISLLKVRCLFERGTSLWRSIYCTSLLTLNKHFSSKEKSLKVEDMKCLTLNMFLSLLGLLRLRLHIEILHVLHVGEKKKIYLSQGLVKWSRVDSPTHWCTGW